MPNLTLRLVSQEKELLHERVSQLTVTTSEGEVTILPGHIPLFTRIVPCELTYKQDSVDESMLVSRGFMSVDQDGEVTLLVDSARGAREVSLAQAQQAIKNAQISMETSASEHELLLAEAELRWALLQEKVAQKTSKAKI